MDTAATVPVQVEVLGPLQLRVGSDLVEVAGPGRRAVLALLAMAGGRVVSVGAIIDALWPGDPPETGAAAVHSHVSRLRRTLGPAAGRLRRVGNGYALTLTPDELDVAAVRRSAAVVHAELATDPAEAAREAAVALGRWRGEALAEFADITPLAADAVGLAELHTTLRDDAYEARLALGDPAVAADLTASVAADPLRERTVTLLMRALAGQGRTAEALETAAAFRRRLASETGLDPGPALSTWVQQIATGTLAPAPPISGAGARRAMARPRSPMVGRERDCEELRRLLDHHATVTVTGPGGVGKTRLVLEVVADLSERESPVTFVGLAAVTDGERVPEAVASALALRIAADPSISSVTDALAGQDLLLVLDNCEHVAAACRELVTLMQLRAPGIRVLATSRVTLHVPDEHVVRLQPLPLPRGGAHLDELARQPGVRAFLEHAQRRQSDFAVTADNASALVAVIRRLDGLPLAIELAAGQLAVLPIAALQQRLHRALDLLAADQPAEHARHRTLRATIEWSYRLLTPMEQALLCALAPFPGGVDLDTVEWLAAETVDHTDPLVLLARLVDASLVAVDQLGATRYTLLDTVRAFLIDELAEHGGRVAAERRFLRWAGRTAEELGRALDTAEEPAADRRLRAELSNLRAARDLARRQGDLDLPIAITLHLDSAAFMRDISELWSWARELAAESTLRGHPLEVAILGSAAEASWQQGDLEMAARLAEHGLDVARQSGVTGDLTRRCWRAIGAVSLFQADFARSRDGWLRAAELSELPAGPMATAAMVTAYEGDRATAEQLLHRARQAGAASMGGLSDQSLIEYVAGEVAADRQQAIVSYLRAIELARSCGASFIEGVATVGLATAWTTVGEVTNAAEAFLWLLNYWPVSGNQTQLWTTVRNVALLLLDQGSERPAAMLLTAADAAQSASAVGGESGEQVRQAYVGLTERLSPAEFDAVRAEAATITTQDVLRLARQELQRLSEPTIAPVPPGRPGRVRRTGGGSTPR